MEALKKTFGQYSEIYEKLTGSQRMMMFIVVGAIVAGLGYVVYSSTSGGYEPASFGKEFKADEMQTAQKALRDQGLANFRVEGNKLLVPKRKVHQYNAALMSSGALPADWASELEKQSEKGGWFASNRKSKQHRDIALGKALQSIFGAHPDVEHADVIWASSKPKRFSGRSPKVTATINITPKSGRELSPRLAESMRVAAANMISDLKPENVVIFNTRTAESFSTDKTGPYSTEFLALIKEYTLMYRKKVEGQLSYIPDVLVSVDVQLNDLEESIERSRIYDPKKIAVTNAANVSRNETFTNNRQRAEPGAESMKPRSLNTVGSSGQMRKVEQKDKSTTSIPSVVESFKRYNPAMRKALKVSVGIPEEYFQKVAEKQSGGSTGGQPAPTRVEIMADVKNMIEHTIGAQPNTGAVEVRPYVRIDREVPDVETPFSESAMAFAGRWAGPIVLAIFALCALWMVKKSMVGLPEVSHDPLAALAMPAPELGLVETELPPTEHVPTPRDELQGVVRDNPEMAAAVVTQWLKAAG